MLKLTKGKSSEVLIDKKNNLVIKKFLEKQDKEYSRGSGYHCFLRELECLSRLQGHINFPKLIRYDEEDLTITMDYCGDRFPLDGQSRPDLMQQVYDIVNKLKEANIKFITQKSNVEADAFPYNNVHIKDGILKFIDYENSLPEGSNKIKYFKEIFTQAVRDQFNIDRFEYNLKDLILKGVSITSHSYRKEIGEIDAMVERTDFTVKKNLWNDYQKLGTNLVLWRINNLKLRDYAGKNKTLLDLGANHGEFGLGLSKDFKHITAVEPFVAAPEMPNNMTWVKEGFKDFIRESNETYDVVFSFAMTIQVRDIELLNEDEIAKGHYGLVKPGGVMIYETQKLENRPINQTHVNSMLIAFRNYFGNETTSGKARSNGKRKYYVFRRTNDN
tara:strand:+ start:251 stop:1411 length:1161 start_codon:yes stop_codon:yes gene_type:complete